MVLAGKFWNILAPMIWSLIRFIIRPTKIYAQFIENLENFYEHRNNQQNKG